MDEILDYLNKKLFFLKEAGFNKQIIENKTWWSNVYYFHGSFAIEFNVDWREQDVFCLIARMNNDTPPKGYYIENGETCRWYIQNFLYKNKIKYDVKVSQMIINLGKSVSLKKRNNAFMKQMIDLYIQLLQSCIDQLKSMELP